MNKYDTPINFDTENSISLILEQIEPNSTILEFGPATGRMTKHLTMELGCSVYIVEIDKEAFKNANKYAKDGICADIEEYAWLERFKDIEFNYIVFADVLEHLINPKKVLTKCKELLCYGGRIITSIPNIAHNSVIIDLLNNKFNYTETGLLDYTHLRFFTYFSIQQMFDDCNLIIEDEKIVRMDIDESGINNSYNDVSEEQVELLKKRELANAFQFVFTSIDKDFYYKNKDKITIKKYNKNESQGSYLSQAFYLDLGEGFNEKSKIVKGVTLNDRRFNIYVDLSNIGSIKELRFDPCEYSCKVKIDSIASNLQDLKAIPENANFTDDNYDIFMHFDPIYKLNSSDISEIKYVEISGEIIKTSTFDMGAYFNKLVTDIKEKSNKIDSVNTELNEVIKTKDNEINIINEKIKTMSFSIEEQNNKIDSLNKELNEVIQSKDNEINIINEKIQTMSLVIAEKNNIIEKLNNFFYNCNKELKEKLNDINILSEEYNALSNQLNSLYNSKSWKLTKPLRYFYGISTKVVRRFNRSVYKNESEIIMLIDQDLNKGTNSYDAYVSVVIPTYNGELYMKELIETLNSQKGIKEIEIVVVDSGSKDNTIKICEEYSVNLITISQNEFSHSYARNLGASKSHGDYIIFMTQDALPSNEYWIYNMLTPIFKHNIVAVSCLEKPRENCELSYLIDSENFAKYLGINNSDKIGSHPKIQNYDTLRKNGQLNDVSCAIVKSVFEKFKYSGDFAEDLDLGVRLIKAGHRIAMLSSERVIHSHNRSCGYYLKRATVDGKTLKRIFPDFPLPKQNSNSIISGTIYAYYKIICLLDYLRDNIMVVQTTSQFFELVNRYLNKLRPIDSIHVDLIQFGKIYSDEVVNKYLKDLIALYNDDHAKETYIMNHMVYYINSIIIPFINNNYSVVDNDLKNEIIDTIFKRLFITSGNELSLYVVSHPNDYKLVKLIEELQKGV